VEVTSLVATFAIIVSIAGIIVSHRVAKKYGDLAAVDASRELHEEDTREARLTAFRSLLNEVKRISGVVDHNSKLNTNSQMQPIVRMPVAAFETAFVSGKPGLDASEELLQAVTDYLVCADSINSLVDIYPFSVAGHGTGTIEPREIARQVVKASKQKTHEVLERLRVYLQEEIS